MTRKHGFTLTELVVVIAIILLLSSLILATAGYVKTKGKRSRTEVELAAITVALENYQVDNGIYPSNDATRLLDPATANPVAYQPASSYLYSQLSGDDDGNPLTPPSPEAKNYFGTVLKPGMLAPNPPGPTTFLQDPFRNSYGYSTAKAEYPAGSVGNNPTFDLWSTANSTEQDHWIRNW